MNDGHFRHPLRFPKNVDGAFYTTGHQSPADDQPGLVWCGDCLWCEAPEHEAPDLLAPLDDDNRDTYFVRQPLTPDEIRRACSALMVCCVAALRYGGQDRTVIRQLGNDPSLCDYVITGRRLRLAVDESGELLPFATRMVRKIERRRTWTIRLKHARAALRRLIGWR